MLATIPLEPALKHNQPSHLYSQSLKVWYYGEEGHHHDLIMTALYVYADLSNVSVCSSQR